MLSNHHFQLSYPSSHPEIDVTQHQYAFNNTLVTIQSDGLFKALFWNSLVQQIVYPYFGEPNSNNQVTLSNNFILLTFTILAQFFYHSVVILGEVSSKFAFLLFYSSCLIPVACTVMIYNTNRANVSCVNAVQFQSKQLLEQHVCGTIAVSGKIGDTLISWSLCIATS